MSLQIASDDGLRKARLMRHATVAAVGVAIFLIAIKATAFVITGSVALLATLVDSALDGVASLLNLVAVNHALRPADREHRFGHGKAEALAGLGQSIFICVSGCFVVLEAIQRLGTPVPMDNSVAGIIVTIVAIFVTILLVAFQRHVVRQTNSLAIEADSTHYRADLLMNLAALTALILGGTLGLAWADPVFGLLIAALILWGAVQIAREAYNQLMDRELADSDRARIKAIACSHPEVRNVHELRTRSSGMNTFIQMHIELDDAISLLRAHRISDEVEARIREAFPDSEVIIHQDPSSVEDLRHKQRV